MKINLLKHWKYYSIFAILQISGFFLMLSLTDYKIVQIAAIYITTFTYISWAILHHYLEHTLNTKIVLEYVLFGILGLIISLLYFK